MPQVPAMIQENVLLAPYTSWKVGGPADFFCLPTQISEVREAQDWARQNRLPISILGGGSNVLVRDRGLRGLVICLQKLSRIETRIEVRNGAEFFLIEALAGTSKSELLKTYLKQRLAPALFLAGIPGDLGGGIVMNAGVSEMITPREFTEIVEWIEVLRPDGTLDRLSHDQIQWSYRHTEGWKPGIVVRAGLGCPHQPDPDMLEKVRVANKIRFAKQPIELPSCGSVFVNPPGRKAAQLIDSCGLKGYTVGAAQVSMKHANFIVNLGGCSAQDLESVIEHVRSVVRQTQQVELVTEVIRLGE